MAVYANGESNDMTEEEGEKNEKGITMLRREFGDRVLGWFVIK